MDFEDQDPFTPVWEGPYQEAQQMLARVEAAHIPVDLDDALLVGHARVVVPRSYADDARAAIEEQAAPWPGLPPEGGLELRPGVPWNVRTLVLYVMVVVVIVALVATLVL